MYSDRPTYEPSLENASLAAPSPCGRTLMTLCSEGMVCGRGARSTPSRWQRVVTSRDSHSHVYCSNGHAGNTGPNKIAPTIKTLSSPPSHKLRHSFLPHVKEPWPFKSPSHSARKCPLPHNARNSSYIAWSLLATTGISPVFLLVFLRHLKRSYSHDRVKIGYLGHVSFLWGAIWTQYRS